MSKKIKHKKKHLTISQIVKCLLAITTIITNALAIVEHLIKWL